MNGELAFVVAILIIIYAILTFLLPIFVWEIKRESVKQTKALDEILRELLRANN